MKTPFEKGFALETDDPRTAELLALVKKLRAVLEPEPVMKQIAAVEVVMMTMSAQMGNDVDARDMLHMMHGEALELLLQVPFPKTKS